MGKKDIKTNENPPRRTRKALTEEAREKQMISLAVNLAEEQLKNGTASSQIITHYLKLGSTKEKIEQDLLKQQAELAKAKVENLKIMRNTEKLAEDAIKAMLTYRGSLNDSEADI